ncbi:hypothetical protein Tco_1373025 [Tanacetum coccineum]
MSLDLHPCLPDPGFTMDHLPGDAIGIYSEFHQFFDRHSCSCISDDLPTDGYDRNDVERLCARLIYLREMREEVFVRSGLSSVWFNKKCDAKVVEESYYLSSPLLERVLSHTTTLAAEGAMIPLPTPDEITASQPDPRLVKKSKGPS